MIFAIDFDGTIVEDKFPEIGALKPEAERVIKRLADKHTIILWTCRVDLPDRRYLQEAVDFLHSKKIHFDAINENFSDLAFGKPKVVADFYLDDKSFPPFMGWLDFESCMEEMDLL